ncbi:hypothetical protein CCACVL1_15409 [Corchorus capsularis]|uniref:Uncharacterized protein n=1 Tax=Corchorus capsularis TaxID=210143 RepID=A0A1R3I2K1_COCAP|nr:hypothetical protein CCACVL1_15409 [Corchorus capsularis]
MSLWFPPVRLPAAPPLPPPPRSPSDSRSKSGVPLPFGPGILSSIIVRFAGITSWTSASSAKPTKPAPPVRNALLLGECATMHFTSTASADGSRLVKCVHWIIVSGSSKSMVTKCIWRLSNSTFLPLSSWWKKAAYFFSIRLLI